MTNTHVNINDDYKLYLRDESNGDKGHYVIECIVCTRLSGDLFEAAGVIIDYVPGSKDSYNPSYVLTLKQKPGHKVKKVLKEMTWNYKSRTIDDSEYIIMKNRDQFEVLLKSNIMQSLVPDYIIKLIIGETSRHECFTMRKTL